MSSVSLWCLSISVSWSSSSSDLQLVDFFFAHPLGTRVEAPCHSTSAKSSMKSAAHCLHTKVKGTRRIRGEKKKRPKGSAFIKYKEQLWSMKTWAPRWRRRASSTWNNILLFFISYLFSMAHRKKTLPAPSGIMEWGNPSYCAADVGRKMRAVTLRMLKLSPPSFVQSLTLSVITTSLLHSKYSHHPPSPHFTLKLTTQSR